MVRARVGMAGVLAVVLGAVLAVGCASTGAADGGSRDRSLITRGEIEDTSYRTALDLIRAERPHWLRVRGSPTMGTQPELVVYVDGVRHGGFDALSSIQTVDIDRIRYYNAREAQARFGAGHAQGAIQVTTRR